MTEIKEKSSCSCGRSPVGRCLGWHDLTEKDYQIELKKFQKNLKKNSKQYIIQKQSMALVINGLIN